MFFLHCAFDFCLKIPGLIKTSQQCHWKTFRDVTSPTAALQYQQSERVNSPKCNIDNTENKKTIMFISNSACAKRKCVWLIWDPEKEARPPAVVVNHWWET